MKAKLPAVKCLSYYWVCLTFVYRRRIVSDCVHVIVIVIAGNIKGDNMSVNYYIVMGYLLCWPSS